MNIQQKLIKLERYLKRKTFNPAYQKQSVIWFFQVLFMEEMKGTKTGDKFREKLEK